MLLIVSVSQEEKLLLCMASQVPPGSPGTDGSYSGPALCRRRTSDASQGLVGADVSRAASIAGFEDPGEDSDCGICLESDHDVAVNGCNHRLCIDCAIRCGSTSHPSGLVLPATTDLQSCRLSAAEEAGHAFSHSVSHA